MQPNLKTFCAASWFQLRQQFDGTLRSCCEIKHNQTDFAGQTQYTDIDEFLNSPYMAYVRHNLNTGNQIKECDSCWVKEKSGVISLRNVLNNLIGYNQPYDKSWLPLYFKNKSDYYTTDVIFSADVKTNNLCNFSCAMCGPSDSSQIYALWQKHDTHPIVQEVLANNPSMLEDINLIYKEGRSYERLYKLLARHPRHVKLLGGEPLLDEKLLTIVENYKNKNKTNLEFVTNGSKDLLSVYNRLSGYKHINFAVSLEGIGDVQDYVRRGSIWKQIESNIIKCITMHPNSLHVSTTMQALTLFHLPELIQWTHTNSIALSIAPLHYPLHHHLNSIPPDLMSKCLDKLAQCNYSIKNYISQDHVEDITISSLCAMIEDMYQFDSDAFSKLRTFLQWYDPADKWKSILPEWLPYL